MFIDFALLKSQVSLEEGARMLGLKLKLYNNQLRGTCPICEGGDSRTLVITPDRGWYCQSAKIGGDVISLVAHIKRLSVKESAKYLASRLEEKEPPKTQEEPPKESNGFDPEKYSASLDNSEDALRTFGVHPDLAKAVGYMGVAKKGINRGKLVFPLRDDFGCIIDFIGVEHVSVPKRWRSS